MDLEGFIVSAFPTTELREIMMENERSSEEMFLCEMAQKYEGPMWSGNNQDLYRLYVDWCRLYEIRPKSQVVFGREMTPFILRGWIGKWGSNGIYGKSINISKIRMDIDD